MNKVYCFTLVLCIGFVSNLLADDWGKTGHRATGEIASKYLTKKAKKNIDKLLKGRSLAYVSIYADEIRSDDTYDSFKPWHYVNFPFDKNYGDEPPSDRGDVVQGIVKCIEVLKNKKASLADKEFYLKMLVHFVGDLHQPLHVGKADDKGGNDFQVRWFNEGTNLHRVWDSDMINFYGMSYSELSENAKQLSKTEIEAIKNGSVLDWVSESRQLAKKVYASTKVGEKLGYVYMYNNFSLVQSQLQKGGIRLAKILNEIFR